MNKKFRCLLFLVAGLAQAQQPDALPLPKPPFVYRAPATAAWTVTYKPKKKAAPAPAPAQYGSGPAQAAQIELRTLKAVQVFKVANRRRIIYHWSDGTKNEKWWVDGINLVEDPGNPQVYAASLVSLPWMPPIENFTDTDFPEFRWIQASMYIAESAARDPSGLNRPHYFFRSAPPKTSALKDKPAKSLSPAEQVKRSTVMFMRRSKKNSIPSGAMAWIDAETRLPIAFDDGVNLQFYSFDPNPPASLELPERFAEKIAQKNKYYEKLDNHIIQENTNTLP